MPLVQLPDGNTLDVPDDATPEQLAQVKAKLSSTYGAPQKPAGWLESTARDALTGFGQGAATIARGAQTAAGALPFINDQEGFGKGGTASNPQNNPLARMLGSAAESAESLYKDVGSKSTNPPIVQGAVRGAAGALTQGPGTVVNLAAGAGSGAAGEAMEKYSPNNPNPLAKVTAAVVGGLAGGTAVGLATRARPQSSAIAMELTEGFTPEQLKVGQAYQAKMAAQGIDIDLAQAMKAEFGEDKNLGAMQKYLANRSQGNAVQERLRAQPSQLHREGQLTVNELPGNNIGPTQAANNLQETATGAVEEAKKARSAAVKSLYEQAGDLPAGSREELIRILQKEIDRAGATTEMASRAKTMIRKLSGKNDDLEGAVVAAREAVDNAPSAAARTTARAALSEANAKMAAATAAPLRALDVDTAIGELRGPYMGFPLKQSLPKESGQIKGLAGQLNQRFQELSPEVAAAEREFARITKESVEPMKQGPVGIVSGRAGYNPETQAPVTKFEGLLRQGTDPEAKVSDLRTLTKELAKVDPTAVEDSLRVHLSRKISDAVETGGVEGQLPGNQSLPNNLYESLFKNQRQWQGLKDVVSEIAVARGQAPADLIRGMENLKKLTFAMTSRPQKLEGLSPTDISQLGGNSQIANAVRVFSFLPVNRAGEAIERATLGKTLRDFDKILTSLEGADMLIKLGRTPVMSKKAQAILGTWGGMVGNSDGLSNSNLPE